MPATATEAPPILTRAPREARVTEELVPYIRILPQEPSTAPSGQRLPRINLREAQCRALNVVVAALGLLFAAPLLALIAVAVKLSSPGPVFYSQDRVGLDRRSGRERRANRRSECRRRADVGGKTFRIYKFRTMRAIGVHGKQVWARADDPRITRIGAVLRKYRLDELPQLYNVLRGDMNIVGPRPEQPEIFQQLRQAVDRYVERQQVLPGITGWAQVNHHYDQNLEDVKRKVSLDLEYIHSRSAARDLRIMAMTLPVMVGKRGAI